MKKTIPLPIIQRLALERGVTKAELEVLIAALAGKPYPEIATELNIKETAVRKRLGEVYRRFNLPKGGGPGKLVKLEQLLQNLQTQVTETAHGPFRLSDPPGADGQGIPFYGRQGEIQTLKKWIFDDCVRLAAVVGLGGIGKTALISHLVHHVDLQFHDVVWRSLTSKPSLAQLLLDLGQELELDSPVNRESDDIDTHIDQMIAVLRQNRYLIILDDFEAVLREKDAYGRYHHDYDDYGVFISKIVKESHKSCLILCSQAPSTDMMRLDPQHPSGFARRINLEGLEFKDAQFILKDKSLCGENGWLALVELYRGNPLALQTIAKMIRDIFGGNVQEFMQFGTTTVGGGYLQTLEEQFERLSVYEIEIIKCLAKPDLNQALSFQDLIKQILIMKDRNVSNVMSQSDLIEALQSLKGRSLIEQNSSSQFSLPPAFKRYVQKHCSLPLG